MKTSNPARRSEQSRQAILSAAFDLVAESGYARLTIEAIAARAGVGKQTIYRWWPSKGAVLVDAFLSRTSDEEGGLALPDTGDLGADLRLVLRAIVDEHNDPRLDTMTRALIVESLNDPAINTEITARIMEPHLEATRERLRGAQRAGQVAEDADLSVAVELLYGPVHHRWMLRTAPLTHEYADTVVEFALRALRVA
ncbi:TetR/AcrR family transcriptional regulator [Streptosporangium sp. NBC_01495]|uniref:TetR/AcrR family transcriptional regulator n=1 Tax=Streptosporangium sp. NBC_01495 TaxID=2903899 RepID=UPI002E2FB036|nr:TetR/AcrR family transcriptional regulator [Streptosporangium sp. NBC_01495]